MLRFFAALVFTCAAAFPAVASSSHPIESEGAAIRIVTSGLGETGELRGVLEIDLRPGWKTYWKSPGEAGVPPEIDLARSDRVTGIELLFPAPERIGDDYATWAGYTRPVRLPLVLKLAEPGAAGLIEGTVFLGICKSICIPIQAAFSLDPTADPDNVADGILVSTAFASLPDEAREGFRIERASRDGDRLLLTAELPEDADRPVLFIAAPETVQIATPRLVKRNGTEATFSADILEEPAGDAAVGIGYTLTAGGAAVDGEIALPPRKAE